MSSTNQQLTPEQKKELSNQRRKNYQRDYYAKMKRSQDFVEKRRETAKKHYSYSRKTIDCPTCMLRHLPESDKCLLLEQARRERMKQCLLDSLEGMEVSGEDLEE
jgi:hypothetical protein